MKLINHIKRWNAWRKHCLNGKMYKVLVLIGLLKSPTLALTLTEEECQQLRQAFDRACNSTVEQFNNFENNC